MKALLIYDKGDEHESDIQFEEFDSKEKMIEYINTEGIGDYVLNAYEIASEIKIKPVTQVTSWGIED